MSQYFEHLSIATKFCKSEKTELELGDKKPSQLLREMRMLAGTQVKDDFLKTIFIQRLPVTT
jgi:hypothetical protein